MKIIRIYESGNVHFNANLLAKKLGKKFFELDEFVRIYVEPLRDDKNGQSFMFYICFAEIYKETVEAMENFNGFIGRIAIDNWCFKHKYFDDDSYIYDFINLYVDDIDRLIEKLEIEENAKKYNI